MRDADAVAAVAGAMGQPSRAAMLLAMGDGRAHSPSSLALTAGILAPAASEHLRQLLRLGLVTVEAAGRERRFRGRGELPFPGQCGSVRGRHRGEVL